MRCSVKRLVILMILLATPFLLFSDTTERVITGIKKTADIPDQFAVVDVYGPEREAIVENSRIIVSDVMRNKTYRAFYYDITGNSYTLLKIRFTFAPLTCSTSLAEATEEEIIPYTVTVSHDSTTAGGTAITDRQLPSGSGIKGDFGGYYYCLGEWVRYDSSTSPVTLSVSGTLSQSVTLNYDFSQNSVVQTQPSKNQYVDVRNYTQNVCCVWTRKGYADFVLQMTEDGYSIPEDGSDPIRFSEGEYSSTVSIEIISGS